MAKPIVIEFDGKKYIVKKAKKDKKDKLPDIIAFGDEYCTGLPWPPTGGECVAPYVPWNNSGEICCKFDIG